MFFFIYQMVHYVFILLDGLSCFLSTRRLVMLITRWEVTSLGWSHPPSDTFLILNHATFCLSFQKCEFYVINFCAIDMSWRCRERLLEGIWVLAVDICRQKKGGGGQNSHIATTPFKKGLPLVYAFDPFNDKKYWTFLFDVSNTSKYQNTMFAMKYLSTFALLHFGAPSVWLIHVEKRGIGQSVGLHTILWCFVPS